MGYREEYRRWLEMFAADKETVKELESIAGDEKEIEDRFYTGLAFGTAGLRGVLGMGTNRMNVYNVRRTTKALARYLTDQGIQGQGVAFGYDSRIMSDVFAKETALTLAANGVKAYLFDALRPVPVSAPRVPQHATVTSSNTSIVLRCTTRCSSSPGRVAATG